MHKKKACLFSGTLQEMYSWILYNNSLFLCRRQKLYFAGQQHSSWMNQIEIWFGIINRKLLKRKSYLSIEELEASILRFIEQYNLTAHPFKWTYAGIPLAI